MAFLALDVRYDPQVEGCYLVYHRTRYKDDRHGCASVFSLITQFPHSFTPGQPFIDIHSVFLLTINTFPSLQCFVSAQRARSLVSSTTMPQKLQTGNHQADAA